MRDAADRPAAPNFTTACVVMFGVNLVWILVLIWAVWGLIAAGALAWAVNRAIDRLARGRA